MRGQDWFQWKLVAVLSLIVFYEQASSRTLGLKAFPCNLVNLLCQCVWSHLRDDSVTSKGTWAQLLSPNVLTPHCKVSCSAAFHLVNEIFFSVGFSIMLFAWHSSIKVLQYTADMFLRCFQFNIVILLGIVLSGFYSILQTCILLRCKLFPLYERPKAH